MVVLLVSASNQPIVSFFDATDTLDVNAMHRAVTHPDTAHHYVARPDESCCVYWNWLRIFIITMIMHSLTNEKNYCMSMYSASFVFSVI